MFETAIEGSDNGLVKLGLHRALEISNNIHLHEKGKCEDCLVFVAKDPFEATFCKTVDDGFELHSGAVDVVVDFLQYRHSHVYDRLHTLRLYTVHVDFLSGHIAIQ